MLVPDQLLLSMAHREEKQNESVEAKPLQSLRDHMKTYEKSHDLQQ